MVVSSLPVAWDWGSFNGVFHVKHEWGGWVGEVDYLASTMSSPGVIEGLVFHVERGSLFNCLEMCDPVFCGCWSVWSSP